MFPHSWHSSHGLLNGQFSKVLAKFLHVLHAEPREGFGRRQHGQSDHIFAQVTSVLKSELNLKLSFTKSPDIYQLLRSLVKKLYKENAKVWV